MPANLKYKNASGALDTLPLLPGTMLLLRADGGAVAEVLGRLTQRDGGWHVDDLRGAGVERNGAHVEPAELPLQLHHMDVLKLGGVSVQFVESPELEPPRPPPEVLWRDNQQLRLEAVRLHEELGQSRAALTRAERAVTDEQVRSRRALELAEEGGAALARQAAALTAAQGQLQAAEKRLIEQARDADRLQRQLAEQGEELARVRREVQAGQAREAGLMRARDQLLVANQQIEAENTDLRAVVDAQKALLAPGR